jgi:hypothetical protein
MKVRALLATLALAACSSASSPPIPGTAGSGGSVATGGNGGAVSTGGGGAVSTGGSPGGETGPDASPPPLVADAASTPPAIDAATPPAVDAGTTPPVAGGTALMIVGAVPVIGDDVTIQTSLEKQGLKVVYVKESAAKAADTEGKALVILSYTLDSDLFTAKNAFVDLPVPYILLERGLLAVLDMATNNKWEEPVTAITISDAQSPLAAGLPAGDVTVYGTTGEVFWGVPGPGALKVATAKGKPNEWTIFAYPKGGMMMTKPAPAKRLHFFLGAHLVPTRFLNENGVKLLDAAIAWSIQ